jgi:preprotein translocase SecE subunit
VPGRSPAERPPRRWHPWSFLTESRNELRKVAWPNRPAVWRNSAIVAATLAACLVVLGVVSIALAWAFDRLLA